MREFLIAGGSRLYRRSAIKKVMITGFIAFAMLVAGLTPAAAKTDEQKFVEKGNSPVDVQSIDWVGKWRSYTFEFFDGGKASFEQKGRKSAGAWSIDSGKICTSWEKFRPFPRCDTFYKDAEGYKIFKPDGKSNSTMRKE